MGMTSKKSRGAVLLLSGGMDSGVLLHLAREEYVNLHCLTFDYGSKHALKEVECARALATKYRCTHNIIHLPFVKWLFRSSLLQDDVLVPDGHYTDESMRSTVVPFRNGILLAIAIGYAESNGLDEVLIANHSGDHAIYPDCRWPFINAMCYAAGLGTYNHVSVLGPFSHLSKKEIADRGYAGGFDFTLTWSCYKGENFHCGTCGTCTERREALGANDPTIYAGGKNGHSRI